jgi:hypothetical protein
MAETTDVKTEEINYLGMSDEEVLAAQVPEFKKQEEEQEDSAETADEGSDEDASDEEASSDDDETAEQAVAESGEEDDAEVTDKVDEETADKSEEKVANKEEQQEVEKEDKKEEPAVDYQAEYNRLLAPFKANGREIAVKSVDDAIALMQMGANYNKKMAALKPNLKLMKLLENNGLLSEEKLSFLIDLDKKNPEAINKLVQDSGIDSMDLSAEKASEYKPKIHTVDDREVELDTVLDEIAESPAYTRTLSIVSKEWDGESKQAIANQPQLLKVINDHVERGYYDLIIKEVESERVFGRLKGLSDIEAYRQVGDAMYARGGFNHLGSSQEKPTAPVVVVPAKPKKIEDDKLKDKRRAASSSKPAAPTSTQKEFNPLAMSDEEFAKLTDDRYR